MTMAFKRLKSHFSISETDNQVSVAHFNRVLTGKRDYGPDCIRRKRKDYFTYLLSGTRLDTEQNTEHLIGNKKNNDGEHVVVISNLESEYDISTMVEQLISKNEFSDASSIFVVVPTSDDNDSDLSSDCSTTCIQLSNKNYFNRNQKQCKCNIEEPEISSRRNSSSTRGLKISAKGKKYCMEGMQKTVASFENKETIFHHRLPNFTCSHRSEEKEKTKNQLCQISTPYQNMILYNGVSTDTTSDRPCCCAPKIHGIHIDKPEHRCVPNDASQLGTPLLVSQGLNCDEYPRLPKINVTQQASIVSILRAPTSVSTCVIPPRCFGHSDKPRPNQSRITEPIRNPCAEPIRNPCAEPIRNPCAEPIRNPCVEPIANHIIKPVSEQKQSEPCQCSPEKIKEIFEQVLKGKASNLKSTGCDVAADEPASKKATICDKPQTLVSDDSDDDEDCGKCSHHKYKKGHKMKCACSGKTRTVKIRALCPCEQHQPPVSKTTAGPKSGTKSRGCQCCSCDSKKKGGPELEVLGPAGGVCQIDLGGTYCQAGLIPSTDPKQNRKDCACVTGKRGKKNKNIICECPPSEPEPEPEPELEPYLYENYQWVSEKQIMRQKSDMTQTQSGFRIFKKKKPLVQPEPEFTVEDAVRYYVSMNRDLIKDFLPPPPEPNDCPCKADIKMKNNDVQCECPPGPPKYGVLPPPSDITASPVPPTRVPTPPPEVEGPSGGFKFSIGGKGSGSKGLSGVCCFDMVQETNISSTKHFK